MRLKNTVCIGIAAALVPLCLSLPVYAQIEDQLSAYTGRNATGYLQPLSDAFGANLNSGLYNSARIPGTGFHLEAGFRIMAVMFGSDDRTFTAVTESGFMPEQRVQAPTVAGPGEAAIIIGDDATSFAFPGGFNLNSFALAVPQVRVGSVRGTEALIRYFSINVGDVELGNLSLFGFGLRHSISQYLGPAFPVDIAGGFFWQRFSLGENKSGDDLVSSGAFTVGVQASKHTPFVEPYAGLSIDRFSMDLEYESEATGETERIVVDFDPVTTLHLTLGCSIHLYAVHFYGEYNIAQQSGFGFGLMFGM